MAKVLLIRKTFAKYLSENADKGDFMSGLFAKAITGMDLKDYYKDIPDEEPVWIDTDKVVAVSGPVTDTCTKETVFSIMFQYPTEDKQKMWFKIDQYEDFMAVWKGERQWLGPGTYTVGLGINPKPGQMVIEPTMWAELSEDKLTVTVREVTPV